MAQTMAFVLDLGRRVHPVLTPDDPAAFETAYVPATSTSATMTKHAISGAAVAEPFCRDRAIPPPARRDLETRQDGATASAAP